MAGGPVTGEDDVEALVAEVLGELDTVRGH